MVLHIVRSDFTSLDNYKKACRFGGEDLKNRLFEYNNQGLYDSASEILDNANDRLQCEKAKQIFLNLGDYRDSAQKADECEHKALLIEYNYALEVFNNAKTENDVQRAEKIFIELRDFKDSAEKAKIIKEKNSIYKAGISLCKSDNPDKNVEGLELLNQIPGYLDADEVILRSRGRINKGMRRQEYELKIHEIIETQKNLYEENAHLGIFSNKRKNEIAYILHQLSEKEQALKEEYSDIID